MLRAAWMVPLFFGIGSAIVVLCRWWGGWHPIWFGEIIVLVGALTAAPIGFLAGIGAFDYWVRYAIGSPTSRRTTRDTARTAGGTTSASTPITR